MDTPSSSAAAKPRRPRPDWWLYFVALLLVTQVTLFVIPQFRPGIVGWLCWTIGCDRLLWLFLAAIFLLVAAGFSFWRRPLVNRWRVIGLVAIAALGAAPFMYQVYPSSHDGELGTVQFRLPLDGPILVGWGGTTPDVNYHVIAPEQRWAYDLAVAKDGSTHAGEGTTMSDYYCFGQPVLAPADGKVVAVLDGMLDQPIGQLGGMPAGGNQIVIEVAPRQFLFLCHLGRGTILVKERDQIVQGAPLAKVGNSGNTSEPHLHIHLQDTDEPDFGEGIPLYFHHYRVVGTDQVIDRGIPTGGFGASGPTGQVVEHVGS
jgi:hypothetical protein